LDLATLQYDYAGNEATSELQQMVKLVNETPTSSAPETPEPAITANEQLRKQLAQEQDWGALQKRLMACVDYQSPAYVEIRDLSVDEVPSYVLAHLTLYEKCVSRRAN